MSIYGYMLLNRTTAHSAIGARNLKQRFAMKAARGGAAN
jgi:hypothetical protein